MAKDLNKAMITGWLGANPELSYQPDGSALVTFRVAVHYPKRGRADEVEWFNIVVWDHLAELCGDQLRHSMRVYVEGCLKARRSPDGRSYGFELVATDVIILDDRGLLGGARPSLSAAPDQVNPEQDEQPIAPGTWRREIVPEPEPSPSQPATFAPGIKPRAGAAVVKEPQQRRPAFTFPEESLPL